MSIGTEHKERLVNQFLRGESVTDLSAFYAVTRTTVEDVLREAIVGLARLNQSLADPKSLELEPKVIIGHFDTKTGSTEALLTPNEGKLA